MSKHEKIQNSGFHPRNDEDFLEADAFVKPIYRPRDEETQSALEELAEEIAVPKREKYLNALASVVVAVKSANAKESNWIAFPGDSRYYTDSLFSWRIAGEVKKRLIAGGHLKPLNSHKRGQAVVYEASDLNLEGTFSSKERWPVRVRESKLRWNKKGDFILRGDCVRRYRPQYRQEEKRLEELNRVYAAHPLTAPDGRSWSSAFRGFNEGRMDRGGRLYGDWQQLKEADRLKLKIDDESLVEIDIVACALFIVSAKAGDPVVAEDPYAKIDWVKDKATRDLAKRLVSAIISKDGPLSQFPVGMSQEFSIPRSDHLNDYQEPILEAFPQLRHPSISGLEAMFIESEAVISTIEELGKNGIIAYPVHDCLLVAERHQDEASRELWRQMEAPLGAKPWLKVSYSDGREVATDPVCANPDGKDLIKKS